MARAAVWFFAIALTGTTNGGSGSLPRLPRFPTFDKPSLTIADLARLRYGANQCRKSANLHFLIGQAIGIPRSRLLFTTIPQGASFPCIFMIAINSSMLRAE